MQFFFIQYAIFLFRVRCVCLGCIMRYRKDGFINKNTNSKKIENEQVTFLLHKRTLWKIISELVAKYHYPDVVVPLSGI